MDDHMNAHIHPDGSTQYHSHEGVDVDPRPEDFEVPEIIPDYFLDRENLEPRDFEHREWASGAGGPEEWDFDVPEVITIDLTQDEAQVVRRILGAWVMDHSMDRKKMTPFLVAVDAIAHRIDNAANGTNAVREERDWYKTQNDMLWDRLRGE